MTWTWSPEHTSLNHGNYFMENYAGAKQDFVVTRKQIFTSEQLTVV